MADLTEEEGQELETLQWYYGHFAAHRQTEWLVGDVREFFRDLR